MSWHERARCLDDGLADGVGIWFSTDPLLIAQAKQECARCPVLQQCHHLAIEVQPDAGVWAGIRCSAANSLEEEEPHEQGSVAGPRARLSDGP